jgi:hypothetical protein
VKWRLISFFAIGLFLLPALIGFVFGVTNLLWQGVLSVQVAFWIRQFCIGLATFGLFLVVARRARTRQVAHIAAVLVISELGSWLLVLAIDGPLVSTLVWSVVSVLLAALAYLSAKRASSRLRGPV